MVDDRINSLAQRLADIAAKAFAVASAGKPAATILIEKDAGRGASLAAHEAADRLGIPMFRLMAIPDLLMGDLVTQIRNDDPGAVQPFITRTVFDAGKKTGGILYIDGSQWLSEDVSKRLARLVEGDLSVLPAMNDIDLSKWIVILAEDREDSRETRPALRAKACVTINVVGLTP
jgi:hypothetical protein